jgi:hypothetical protein
MNLGVRVILLAAAVICFIIAIFTDLHQGDWLAIGLALFAGPYLVADMGWDRPLGAGPRRTD